MTTEIYIENHRLDVSADISTLLNFAVDDIKDFSQRSTTWSKTIILPGTANNNKLFGHIFQIGQSNGNDPTASNINYNYNASRAADCLIFQDQMQTFKGVLRLMQINITKGQIEYEAAVFGEIAGLNVALSSGLLESLDFSAYDHVYNASGITGSWDTINGTGYYYPLIDHGGYSVAKDHWDIRTFRPALYVREYIDKMFTAAGFRWECDLFDTARFKSLIVPHNKKVLLSSSSLIFSASNNVLQPSSGLILVEFPTQTGGGFTTSDDHLFTYAGVVSATITIDYSFLATTGNGTGYIIVVYKNGAFFHTQNAGSGVTTTGQVIVSLAPGDVISFRLQSNPFTPSTLNATTVSWEAETSSAMSVPIAPGDTVTLNDTIPKNIRQIDFLVSIIKLFNLYVYESRNDDRLILIKPYIDFYSTDSTDSVDWTYKLNRDKTLRIKPMSELNAKMYEFKYKSDSDYYNDLYRKRYGQGYGDYVFDSSFEFAEQIKAFEIIFSATPLVGYAGEDKIFSTIFKLSNNTEEPMDCNIRILQAKKITGVTSWDILDGVSVLSSQTVYGYGGHFDDPDAPSNDLNFGVLAELFFTLVTGDLTATQFNVYWSAYMAEITDKDSKLLSAYFYLTAKDIMDLDFSKKVFLDGVLFRLNQIKDYNASSPTDCECELLKVNYLIY